jgi:RNA polymerase sigma-54 factor
MRQTLQLKLGQHLTMTPQLQQAIRLLQLSAMELGVEVQDALESNMMLEPDDDNAVPSDGDTGDEALNGEDVAAGETGGDGEIEVAVPSDEIPEDLPVDSEWTDIYDSMAPAGGSPGGDSAMEFDNFRAAETSLREHLLWQVNLLPLSETDRAIAHTIVDTLNDDGYLDADIETLHEMLNASGALAVEEDEVGAVLKQIQGLEPAGVAARDLRECLLLQLNQHDVDTPWLNEARRVCADHLAALGTRDYTQVMRRMKLDEDSLGCVLNLIRSLNPKPGEFFNSERPEYIVPDVYVKKVKRRWKVELNTEAIPQLRVNPLYAAMIKRADNSPDNNSLKAHLQEAKWFIKSLRSRSETLLRVATAIVERQQGFLEHGEEAMKPLVLHDIAETLGMHESTISRVTTRKYMHTPRGIFELKYFFSSHVATAFGGEASSTAIRAVIKKLISAENTRKPLSDSKIANLLSDQGVRVARRTIAKYREAMQIPPSNERKTLA